MSLLEIKSNIETDGIKKTIDRESNDVALYILQRGIYAFPVKSTIRELASNSYDANIEREVAKSILNGKSKVEDHYDTTKVDGIYHSSGWDPNYYNQKFLSTDMNIYIIYEEGLKKDVIRIKDNGIGLGNDRLIGYFQLSYSSKRSQKGALGKWGLGNKSPLSLGIDSFTVINRYEGKIFRFEVFVDNVVSATPKFSNGKLNDYITVDVPQPYTDEDGNELMKNKEFIFYYEETTAPNGLEVVVPVKKYQKNEFFKAVEEQLMYIPNVVFKERLATDIDYSIVDIKAKVMYRDKNIIISESTVFNQPHILLGTGEGLINYGIIDFPSLELEKKFGAVGLILDINDVEVTPSRESIVYSTKTRNTVIVAYNNVVETATNLINTELRSATDYLDWVQKTGNIKNALLYNNSDSKSALQQLAGIIDIHSINDIKFKHGNNNILFTSDPKLIFGEQVLVRKYSYNKWNKKIDRIKIKSVNTIAPLSVYLLDGPSDKYIDRYIFEKLESNTSFIVIKKLENWKEDPLSLLLCTSNIIKDYKGVIIPEDIMDIYLTDEINTSDSEGTSLVKIDPNRLTRLRKLNKEILFHYITHPSNPIVFSSKNIKISDIISSFSSNTILYGTFKNRDLISEVTSLFPYGIIDNSIHSEYMLSYEINTPQLLNVYNKGLNDNNIPNIKTILLAQENLKYFKNKNGFINISDFIIESYNDKKLIINRVLRHIFTYKIIAKMLSKIAGCKLDHYTYDMDSMKKFYGEEFLEIMLISKFVKSSILNTTGVFFSAAISYEMGKHDNMDQDILNDYLSTIDDNLPDEICDKIDEIRDIHIVDIKLIDKVKEYVDFYEKFIPIIKHVNHGPDKDILEILDPLITHLQKPKPLGRIY